MSVGSSITRFFGAIWWGLRYGPVHAARWLRAHLAYAMATLWLGGVASFVGVTVWRATEVQRAAEAKRKADEQAAMQARIEAEIEERLGGKPRSRDGGADGQSAGDGGAGSLLAMAKNAAGAKGGKKAAEEEKPTERPEVIELMDIDDMEKARGGSDEAAKEAIAGLAEEYEEEDGGVGDEDGGVGSVAGGGRGRGDGGAIKYETIQVGGGQGGEPVTIKMKEGGIAGWINRNKKHRKRKLGDKETLEVLLGVTEGVGTKVNVGKIGQLQGLAAIAAIRGSAVAEEEETGEKVNANVAEMAEPTESGEPAAPPSAANAAAAVARGEKPAAPAGGAPVAAAPVRAGSAGLKLQPIAGSAPVPTDGKQKPTVTTEVAAGDGGAPTVVAAAPAAKVDGGLAAPSRGVPRTRTTPLADGGVLVTREWPDAGPPPRLTVPPPAPVGFDVRGLGLAMMRGMLTPKTSSREAAKPTAPKPPPLKVADVQALQARLKPLLSTGKVKMGTRKGSVVLVLPGDMLFDTVKSTDLRHRGEKLVRDVAQALGEGSDTRLQITARTQPAVAGVPPSPSEATALFMSAASRAGEVARALAEGGVDPEHLTAAVLTEGPVAADDPMRKVPRPVEITIVAAGGKR